MAWRTISDCLPAELMFAIEEARNRGSDERAPARPAVGFGGDQPRREENTLPVAFARGDTQTEFGKGPGRTPAKVQEEQRSKIRPFPPTIGREIATVTRRNRSEPHAPAVVISLAMYRAQRRAVLGLGEHHSHPFALATLSASKASPTTVSSPKYTNLLIAQPTQE